MAPLIQRFGLPQVIAFGMALMVLAYGLLLRIGLDSSYWTVLFPTFALVGFGFGFAYGPLNIAATNGVSASEQGLASGMVQTSFQFGGALVLAIVTAVNSATVDGSRDPGALLDGYQTALIVPVIVAALGLAITLFSVRTARPIPLPQQRKGTDDDSEPDRRCHLRRLKHDTRSAVPPGFSARAARLGTSSRLGAGRERRGAIGGLRRRRQRRTRRPGPRGAHRRGHGGRGVRESPATRLRRPSRRRGDARPGQRGAH